MLSCNVQGHIAPPAVTYPVMTIYMPQTSQEERWRWIRPIITNELTYDQVLRMCPHSRRTLKYWVSRYRDEGEGGLVPRSTRPKRSPERTSEKVRKQVIRKRKETGFCAKKLHWRLEKEGLSVPVRTIGKILNDEGLARTYRKRKTRYTYLPRVWMPGDMVEIDVKHVPQKIENRRYFQYTAVDLGSRWRLLDVFEEQSSRNSVRFLDLFRTVFPVPVISVKTDNHSTFTNYYVGSNKRSDMTVKTLHQPDVYCRENTIIHYLIDPGKPTQNGTVERSHREDNEKFYRKNTFSDFSDLQKKLRVWNDTYNDLEHCSLNGKTPNEMLQLLQPQGVQYVLA